MRSAALETVTDQIEQLEALDGLSGPLQDTARRLVPQESRLKDVLSGSWLGHPVHPPLTDVVLGAWTSALILDAFGGEGSEQAADRLVAAGVVAALPTAATGLSDWAELSGGTRRLGSVHAIGNTTALALHTLSWAARRRGNRGRGIALSVVGYGIATFAAWLGGHLSFRKGIGVDQTVFEDGPSDWTAVIDEAELEDGMLTGGEANGLDVLLVRAGGRVHALVDRCSHRGCALHVGELRDETVICPCHGSTFRLDGTLVKGPATASQPSFEVRVHAGKVEIRRAGTS